MIGAIRRERARLRRLLGATMPAWLWQRTDQEWERFGKLDPYFGVASDEKFRSAALNSSTLDDFFESGTKHVDEVFGVIRKHIRPDFRPDRALDFGCGVGRITIPLAGVCAQVVGVDVSPSMLEEARRNCDLRHLTNVELFASDDVLSAVPGHFDFVHSFIVLQHIPPPRGEQLIGTLLTMLSEEGVALLQFTYHRRASRGRRAIHWFRRSLPFVNGLANAAQGRPLRYPFMDMHNYNLNRVFLILHDLGCDQCHVQFTDHGGHLGLALFLMKPRTDEPRES